MKIFILICLVSMTLAIPAPHPHNYFTRVGVPLANQIRASEQASDFDGSRIVGGTVSTLGRVPYIAGVVITLTTGFQGICGSTILTNTIVITAAHCANDGWNKARQFVVVLGSLTIFSGGTRRTTTDVVVHEGWNAPFSIDHDIALIRFASVTFTANINSINLPIGSTSQDYTNVIGLTAGWGRQSDTATIPTSQRLHTANLVVLSDSNCQMRFGDAYTQNMMCVIGIGGSGTCNGDAGGPLVANQALIGITSLDHNADGCSLGYPVIFTKVSPYVSWIYQNMLF